jgi:hypothetical protein
MGIAGRARKVMLARDRGCAQWPVSVPQTDGRRLPKFLTREKALPREVDGEASRFDDGAVHSADLRTFSLSPGPSPF